MPTLDKILKGTAQTVASDGNATPSDSGEQNNTPITPQTPQQVSNDNENQNIVVDIKKLKEEEARKKREEQMREKLREVIREETRYSNYNKHTIQGLLLDAARKEKAKELIKNIAAIEQNHDRQVDRKDAVIQMLYRDIHEAEEQYKLALRTQYQHLDELYALNKQMVNSLEEEFRTDMEILKKEFQEEREEILSKHQEEVQELEEIREEMRRRDKAMSEQLETEYLHTKETIKNSYSQKYNMQNIKMKQKILEYNKVTKEENIEHCDNMNAKYTEYLGLRNDDDDVTEEIKNQTKKIKIYEESLAHWKAKWLNNLRECEERNKKLIEEKNALNKHFTELKKKMNKFRCSEEKRLKELVSMSHETLKISKEKLEKANRILHLGELSQKYETERERIIPFEQYESLKDVDIKDEGPLAKFYTKYNKVLLDNTALEQEKEHLISENQQLRQMLKNYLDGISVNEDVLNNKNPLLMINSLKPIPKLQYVEASSNQNGKEKEAILS